MCVRVRYQYLKKYSAAIHSEESGHTRNFEGAREREENKQLFVCSDVVRVNRYAFVSVSELVKEIPYSIISPARFFLHIHWYFNGASASLSIQ